VNTPTFRWAYTRTFKERGKKRSVTRSTLMVPQMQWDAVYIKKKRKIGYEKYSQNNNNHNKSGKVNENETLGKL
jgi:hypothetical protein